MSVFEIDEARAGAGFDGFGEDPFFGCLRNPTFDFAGNKFVWRSRGR
jgi:hypothetical protein